MKPLSTAPIYPQLLAQIAVFLCLLQINPAYCAVPQKSWHIGIGDPTVFGWLTTLSYLIAFIKAFQLLLSYVNSNTNSPYQVRARLTFWCLLSAFLLVLGLNKQLDLQTLLRQVLIGDLIKYHFYTYRHYLQIILISGLAVLILLVLSLWRTFFKNYWQKHRQIWLGIVLLFLFIFTRALTFQFRYEPSLLVEFAMDLFNFIFENTALILIIIGINHYQKIKYPV